MSRSEDYHAYISEVHKTPSILTDVPQYPNAHLAFNKKQVVYKEEEVQPRRRHHLFHRHRHPETREKVEVVEYEQTAKVDNSTGEVVYEEDVDVEADQQYRQKDSRGFQLHKWKTFDYQD